MMLMAVAAIASCEKQNTLEKTEAEVKTYTYSISANAPELEDVTLSAAQAPATRTNYDSEGHFSWSAGDAISVLFHKDLTNKFFTLTTTESDATATFSGEIEEGYTIGAADGTELDKKIWALFPASNNHTFQRNKANTADSVRFYVQPSVDFTATHFSANIPMYDLVASAETSLSFKSLASTYKFIVNGIKNGVTAVDFSIYNQTTYALSGTWPIHGDKYINYNYAKSGSANSYLRFTSAVTNNQAVFYVPCRYYGNFQPVVTVTNHATGVAIKTFTATVAKTPNYKNGIWPITLDVSEANGGNYYTPAIVVDGDLSDWSEIAALPSSQSSRIREWKFKADAYNVYFYFSLRKNRCGTGKTLAIGFNTDNDTATGDNYDENKILGNETIVTSVPFTNTVGSELTPVNGYDGSSSVMIHGGSNTSGLVYVYNYDNGQSLASDSSSTYIELSIPRSSLNLPAAGNTITIGCAFDYYVTGTQSITLE